MPRATTCSRSDLWKLHTIASVSLSSVNKVSRDLIFSAFPEHRARREQEATIGDVIGKQVWPAGVMSKAVPAWASHKTQKRL